MGERETASSTVQIVPLGFVEDFNQQLSTLLWDSSVV